jgi:hypothetical protein
MKYIRLEAFGKKHYEPIVPEDGVAEPGFDHP